MPDRSDYTTGDTTKVGARVDSGIYAAFREWVEEQTGKQYNEVGSALERAMLEYMDHDRYNRLSEEISEVDEQAKKNEALIKQVIHAIDEQKERGQNSESVPQGKDPGSRRQREAFVIRGLLLNEVNVVGLDLFEEAIREFAEVSSEPTIQDYIEAITDTEAMMVHNAGQWRLDPDGAREVCERRGVSIPDRVEK